MITHRTPAKEQAIVQMNRDNQHRQGRVNNLNAKVKDQDRSTDRMIEQTDQLMMMKKNSDGLRMQTRLSSKRIFKQPSKSGQTMHMMKKYSSMKRHMGDLQALGKEVAKSTRNAERLTYRIDFQVNKMQKETETNIELAKFQAEMSNERKKLTAQVAKPRPMHY